MDSRHALVLTLAFTLAGCGGSSSGDSAADSTNTGSNTGNSGTTGGNDGSTVVSGPIQYLGMVDVDEYEDGFGVYVEGSAGFLQFGVSVDSSRVPTGFVPELETCVEWESTVHQSVDDVVDHLGGYTATQARLASAGEIIPIMSGSGSYVDLERKLLGGVHYYFSSPYQVMGPMPRQLALDIPGDEFPPISGVNIPVVESLVTAADYANMAITTETQFNWTAGSNANAMIYINFDNYSDDLGLFEYKRIECLVKDDGAFSLPEQTKTVMRTRSGFSGAKIGRIVMSTVKQGNAVLMLTARSER